MKNSKAIIFMFLISLTLFIFSSCNSYSYQQISQKQAREIMNTETDYIILDVRTVTEFSEGHIENAINIDHEEINLKAEELLTDKEKLILVYCRSGRRSKIAAQALTEMGYINVKEFGGIIDWEYETVK